MTSSPAAAARWSRSSRWPATSALVLGPVVTGLVADAAGYSPAFVVCAVVCVLPVFAVLAAPETLLPERAATAVSVDDAARDAT